ncbi:MAG: hypothetical protein CME13_03610 [Gemmatimonadetes bacterium]|nr:hypothetical protein [Gemmatimonadota bacterium]HCV23367.1 hypothetical protein [Candidatus Latescibacterota bacterium]
MKSVAPRARGEVGRRIPESQSAVFPHDLASALAQQRRRQNRIVAVVDLEDWPLRILAEMHAVGP